MKRQLLHALLAVILSLMPIMNFGQAPNLGAASSFVLFTAVGAFNNTNALSVVTGDVGTNVGAFNAFPPGTLIGQKHVADPVSVIAAADVLAAYTYLSGLAGSTVISTTLDDQVLTPGLYSTGAASSLSASKTITLNGAGIYILQIGGALSLYASSQVVVSGGADLCDVYWQINGQVDVYASATFRGTIVANGAINLLANSILYGRGLSRAGAIGTDAITATLDCSGCPTLNKWTNTSGDFKWTTASNWSLGHIPMLTDELLINTGTTLIITDVPSSINIDKLHVMKNGISGAGTNLTLKGSVDASVIILHGVEICLQIAFEVEDECKLYCNIGNRVNIILMPTANGRLDATSVSANNAVFEPAIYYNCDALTTPNLDQWIDTTYGGNILNYYKTKGFLMRAGTSQHAEFIQQTDNDEKVLGWVEWTLPWESPTFAGNNVHYTSIPIWTDLTDIPCCLSTGDVLHELNIVNNYGFAIKPVGYYVRKWDGANQIWSQRNEPPRFVTGWYSQFVSCDVELNILQSGGKVNDPFLGHVEAGEGLEIFPKSSWPDHPSMVWYGPLNTYPTTAPLTWDVSLPISGIGWVLLGNPFASAIKLGEITGSTLPGPGWNWPSTIDPAIYYWDATIQGYKYWNYVTHDSLNFPAGTNQRANYIARNQGFFVHSSAPFVAGTFQLDNRARQFRPLIEIVKSASADIMANNMRLNVTYTDQNFKMDEMVVHFIDNASTNYMRGIDAYKLFRGGNSYSDLYTVTNDNENVAIKYYQSATGTTIVPIHFQVGPSGNYEFRANELNSFSSRTGIQLVDKKVNKTQDMKADPVYSFSSANGDDSYRFDLLFTDVLNGVNNLTNDGLNVYSSGSSIFIVSDKIQDVNGTVTVYDMIGRQMIRENLKGDLITRLNINLEKGYYVISVRTDKAVINRKVYID